MLLENEEDPEQYNENTMYFDFPRLLIILTINSHSNLKEKLKLLIKILLEGKKKFRQKELIFFFS